MYKPNKMTKTKLHVNNSYEGDSIEARIRRIMHSKEKITDGAPLIYTPRNTGVNAAYNIRTDRWEIALEAMDWVTRAHTAKREERHKPKEEDGKTKPIQATDENGNINITRTDKS